MPQTNRDIVFLENGMAGAIPWNELFGEAAVKTISFDEETVLRQVLADITHQKPASVFLLLGVAETEDLTRGSFLHAISSIISRIHTASPATSIFVQSLVPCRHARSHPSDKDDGGQLRHINLQLAGQTVPRRYAYIDVCRVLCDGKGFLKPEYGNDNRLSRKGCMMWKHLLYPYVYGLQAMPSLVPMPRHARWTPALFPLYEGVIIDVKDRSLTVAGKELARMLRKMGIAVKKDGNLGGEADRVIELAAGRMNAPVHEEGYQIDADESTATVTANTPRGAFNAIQTLRQLMRDGTFIPGCHITDWPAFSWRGYMVDVARNYQSVRQLKQQADMMSRYKLNILHLHLTDDIAWRLEIGRYPGLTAPENMLRDKGRYYSTADMKALIRYCRRRFITLVPELDMPGHSGAFHRTFGTDMQSLQGTEIVRNILNDVSSTYELPCIHLGTDETRVTNRSFIPEMVSLVQGQGKKVIGWSPGIEAADVIRQLWGNGPMATRTTACIDSRGLYLNHLDPLAGVISIFGRGLCRSRQGNDRLKGGEICLWNDRKVAGERDLLHMNPVYPCMLAFAERSWRGDGFTTFTMAMGKPGSSRHIAFASFEKRLVDQKRQYFTALPFPYIRQRNISWKLFGPFDNNGDLKQAFWPETENVSLADRREDKIAMGGTVILRHWWHPAIRGWLDDPHENTTFYAWRRFRKDAAGRSFLWAGFSDPSRSTATDDPTPGTWDDLQSRIWFNRRLMAPPEWKHGSAAGNSEIPLVDEGYSYRAPLQVDFKKGWNEILIKAPVGAFSSSDWQNPVKWMFTAVCVGKERGCNWFLDE